MPFTISVAKIPTRYGSSPKVSYILDHRGCIPKPTIGEKSQLMPAATVSIVPKTAVDHAWLGSHVLAILIGCGKMVAPLM
jgi:hypothetical protein